MSTILIIDSNDEVRENTAEILELNRYKVVMAKDDHAGLELAKKQPPDLILYDLVMPGTQLPGFIKAIRQQETMRDIPLIFFSRGTGEEIGTETRKSAAAFIKKPFTEQELLSGITSVL